MGLSCNGSVYYISAVRYDRNRTKIESVKLIHSGTMKEVGGGFRTFPKEKIIGDIESGRIIYKTMPPRDYYPGDMNKYVKVITGCDGKFLRSDDNGFIYDSLEAVPEF